MAITTYSSYGRAVPGMIRIVLLSLTPVLLLASASAYAGDAPSASSAPVAPPRAVAVFSAQPPVVDGVVDATTEWKAATPIVFSDTEVRFLWTDDGMFVSARAVDKTPVFGSFRQGDPLYLEDVFEVFIDEVGDGRQFVEIQCDPAGQIYIRNNLLTAEPRLTEEGRLTQEFVERELWRCVLPAPDSFHVASRYDKASGAWSLELFLPKAFISRRKGGAMSPCTWRVNLVRHDWDKPSAPIAANPERHGEMMYWAPVLRGHPHLSPTRMGFLELKK
ncbi:MAG: carbohydrate-binding family 9-like protein [Candidatus Methylacidiphilales bacterium]